MFLILMQILEKNNEKKNVFLLAFFDNLLLLVLQSIKTKNIIC